MPKSSPNIATKKPVVSNETLNELKKQILSYEQEKSTRDVVGRRLWNYLKANATAAPVEF
jgi:hypothetical protein